MDRAFPVSAAWYDALYAWKDYRGEAERITALVRAEVPHARTLLDAACGTGEHLRFLGEAFAGEGFDNQPDLLAAARAKCPGTPLHEADLRDFRIPGPDGAPKRFDAITCLFSAIGYLTRPEEITAAFGRMAEHLAPDGILLVEPWFTPDVFRPTRPHMLVHDGEALKVCRMSEARVEDGCSVIDFYYQVAEGNRVFRAEETHRLRLSTVEELLGAFAAAGLDATYLPDGLMPDRGLYRARHAR